MEISCFCITALFVKHRRNRRHGDTESGCTSRCLTNSDFTPMEQCIFTEWQPPIRCNEGIKKALQYCRTINRCPTERIFHCLLSIGKGNEKNRDGKENGGEFFLAVQIVYLYCVILNLPQFPLHHYLY